MKTIRWLTASALLGAAAVAALLSTASAGDVLVQLNVSSCTADPSAPCVLTGPQAQAYGQWVQTISTAVPSSQISDLICTAQGVCTARWIVPEMTAEQYSEAVVSPRFYRDAQAFASDDSAAYRVELHARKRIDWDPDAGESVDEGEWSSLTAINEAVFGVAAESQIKLHVWTVYDDDGAVLERRAELQAVVARTPAQLVACRRAALEGQPGACHRVVGVVVED